VRIDLVPVRLGLDREHVPAVAAWLERAFDAVVRERAPWFDPESCYDASRGQYSSTRMLEALLDGAGSGADRILGLTGVDLFLPALTWVFGEAQLSGVAAVVSTSRLHAEAYGLPADPDRVRARLVTEAVHELGHTFGLLHCLDPACAMRASTYAEEIDLKTSRLCVDCAGLARRDRPVLPLL
jgi:archaemetzincin